MTIFISKHLVPIVAAIAFAAALAAPAAPAAAASAIYVDDDNAQCATPYHHISDALAFAASLPSWPTSSPKTIIVCSGKYPEPAMFINGTKNLKLIAKPGVFVWPNTPAFAGWLFGVNASTNVTIRGFNIDGLNDIGFDRHVLNPTAIYYASSSGLIQRNTISNWRNPAGDVNDRSIAVANFTGEVARVDRNVIGNFMAVGIDVGGPKQVVTRNVLDSTSFGLSPTWAIAVSGDRTRVVGNKIASDAYPAASPLGSRGIAVSLSTGVKLIRNDITHFDTGIYLSSEACFPSGINKTRVTGNMLLDTFVGVRLVVDGTACPVPSHGDDNRITGNRILIDAATLGDNAVYVSAGPAGSTAQRTIVKNNRIQHYNPGWEIYLDPLSGGDYTGSVTAPNVIIP